MTNMNGYLPGVVQPGDGTDQRPIAVVTTSRARLHEYIQAARVGPWVWVRQADDVRGLQLGGAALLDADQLPDELRDAVAGACLA